MHERAAAPAGRARGLRRALERGAGDRRRAGGGRPPTRRSSSARSCGARRASRCSSRPPTRARTELKAQGVRPRVWFGERWITSIFDLFEENVRYFPALLPVCDDEDPVEVLTRGDIPELARAAAAQRHDLPLEPADLRRRPRAPAPARGEPVLPAGPDGGRHPRQRRLLLRARAHADRGGPAAVDADVVLGGRGELPRRRARRHRRPRLLARRGGGARVPSSCCAGCCRWRTRGSTASGVDAGDRDRLLGIIERRCVALRNGASWQAPIFHRLYDERGLDRDEALRRDDHALPRAHARQRARARLAAGLAPADRARRDPEHRMGGLRGARRRRAGRQRRLEAGAALHRGRAHVAPHLPRQAARDREPEAEAGARPGAALEAAEDALALGLAARPRPRR